MLESTHNTINMDVNISNFIPHMSDFEKSVVDDIYMWAITKYGNHINPLDNFNHYRDLYWKEKLS